MLLLYYKILLVKFEINLFGEFVLFFTKFFLLSYDLSFFDLTLRALLTEPTPLDKLPLYLGVWTMTGELKGLIIFSIYNFF